MDLIKKLVWHAEYDNISIGNNNMDKCWPVCLDPPRQGRHPFRAGGLDFTAGKEASKGQQECSLET